MSSIIYSGSTPKFLIKIRDENGLQLDPRAVANPIQVTAVWAYIYNAITGVVIGKFYFGTAPNPLTGWELMTVTGNMGTVPLPDYRLKLILTAAQTQAAEGNSNTMQITLTVPDADVPGGRIVIKTGKFSEIVKSKP